MNKNKLIRICPICSNKSGEVLHTQHFIIPQGHPLPSCYDVVACEKCEFSYADSSAGQKDYDFYYEQYSKYEDPSVASGTGINPWDKVRSEDAAMEIAKYIQDKNAAITDIGCANGSILAALQSQGFKNLIGIDPSSACIKFIKKQWGINNAHMGGIFAGPIIDDRSFKEAFDCVILSHVLEHICDLKSAISNVANILRPGGMLFIEVPDASRYYKYFVVPYYYFDCEHINHFDKYALHNLLSLSGFEKVGVKEKVINVTEHQHYPVVDVIYRKSDNSSALFHIQKNENVKNSILQYIEKSKQNDYSAVLRLMAQTQDPVIVWGAGSFTQRLLKDTELSKCNIVALVDKDSKKWNTIFNGIAICPPDVIKQHEATIIICSALYSDDIVKEIKEMNVSNKYITVK